MTDLEKAEKLREKTGVSYTEAKEALDSSDGSLLDALVYLEKQGKVETPPGGGFYSGAGYSAAGDGASGGGKQSETGSESFSDLMRRFGVFCKKVFSKGMTNYLVAVKNEERIFAVPIIIFILLLLAFWVTFPVFIITLFCGIRYRLSGPDFDKESVNKVMESASDLVDDVKRTLSDDDDDDRDENKNKKNNADDEVFY